MHLNPKGEPCNCGFGKFQPQMKEADVKNMFSNEEGLFPFGGLFHIAPTEERARIKTHGLQPASPHQNAQWAEATLHGGVTGLEDQPVGVYGHETPNEAKRWTAKPEHSNDIWFIPESQIRGYTEDPILGTGSHVITHPVHPVLYQGAEHAWNWPHEEQEMGNLTMAFPDPEWKMGEPTPDYVNPSQLRWKFN